jgi:hypothetical protein
MLRRQCSDKHAFPDHKYRRAAPLSWITLGIEFACQRGKNKMTVTVTAEPDKNEHLASAARIKMAQPLQKEHRDEISRNDL